MLLQLFATLVSIQLIAGSTLQKKQDFEDMSLIEQKWDFATAQFGEAVLPCSFEHPADFLDNGFMNCACSQPNFVRAFEYRQNVKLDFPDDIAAKLGESNKPEDVIREGQALRDRCAAVGVELPDWNFDFDPSDDADDPPFTTMLTWSGPAATSTPSTSRSSTSISVVRFSSSTSATLFSSTSSSSSNVASPTDTTTLGAETATTISEPSNALPLTSRAWFSAISTSILAILILF